jgi:glycosyltransferase involved in cell wall biosynthesis
MNQFGYEKAFNRLLQQYRIKDFGEMIGVTISVVIPAFNEARTLGQVVEKCKVFCNEVIVVNDGSTDNTRQIAEQHGAKVVQNKKKLGVAKATQKGFEAARGNIIVTIDADGQHEPSDMPKLMEPLTKGMGEVALGVRDEISHRSERIINALVNLNVKCSDSGTGFRAIKADLAKKMKPHGTCFCGTFVLEAHKLGARIVEIPIQTKPRAYGKRKMKTRHLRQIFYVLRDLIFTFLGRFFKSRTDGGTSLQFR